MIKGLIKKVRDKLVGQSRTFRFIFLPVLFLFIISLLAAFISFSKEGHIILGGDLYYPINSNLDISRIPFAWDMRYAAGQTSDGRHIPSFLFFLFFSMLDKLSIPLIISQKIAIFSIFSFTAPAMYYLVLVIYKYQQKEINARACLVAFAAACFYNFNLWNLFNWSSPSVHLQLSYLATPIVLAFFIQGLRKNNYIYACFIALLSVFFSPSASNPIYILDVFWPVGFFIAFIIIEKIAKRDWRELERSLLYSLAVFFIFVLINLWWILPMADTLKSSVNDMSNSNAFWKWLDRKSARSSFLNIFRLINHEAWSNTTSGNLIIESAGMYANNIFFIIISFLFPLLAFLKLLQKKKYFFVLYFLAMALAMVFLAKGVHEPFSGINEFLHKKILFLKLYRSVEWYTPMIVLSFAYLFGEGLLFAYDFFLRWRGKKQARYILALIILVCFIYNYPFWMGKVVHQGMSTGEIANSYFVKIPAWYFSASEWINNQRYDFRIVSEPSATPYYHTNWGFSGGELGTFLFNKPIINNIFGLEQTKYLSLMAIDFLAEKDNKTLQLANILSLMNVKYIALRYDATNWNPSERKMVEIDSGQIAGKLESQEEISLDKTIGNIAFFNNKKFLPHFYIPENNIVSRRTIDDIPRIVSSENWIDRSAMFFENQNIERANSLKQIKSSNDKENKELPIAEFKKIDPVKYRVRIHKASGVFPLVFLEAFHNGWQVYLTKAQNSKSNTSGPEDYKILVGNNDDQADKDELANYIKSEYVTTLGDGKEKTIEHKKWDNMNEKLDYVEKYKIDFISKNFQGTIQNNNLPNGSILETWFKKPIDNNENHLIANAYANSWMIDPQKLCKNNNYCVKNPDGSYDFELTVEFWPQRLFYIGLGISFLTLLACSGYLMYYWSRRHNKETQ